MFTESKNVKEIDVNDYTAMAQCVPYLDTHFDLLIMLYSEFMYREYLDKIEK